MDINLMIVDDEPEIVQMLSRHFRFLGYSVDTASDGMEALEKMTNTKTDIVISDIMMPRMDGVELCGAIRKDYPMTRVIMITGYVTLANALACCRRGAETCIFKPLEDLSEVELAVENAVEKIQHWLNIFAKLSDLPHSDISNENIKETISKSLHSQTSNLKRTNKKRATSNKLDENNTKTTDIERKG